MKIFICVKRVFLSTDMLRSCAIFVVALQPINLIGGIRVFSSSQITF